MKIVFLGTGTSQGVPVIGCRCAVCKSQDQKDKRLRSSVMVSLENKNVVIDTGPDFRQQMLREDVNQLEAVLFTHEHKDHIAGLDDIRAFNFLQKKPVDVYATKEVQEALKREYHYAFSEEKYPGIPQIALHNISNVPFKMDGFSITPIQVLHYKMPVLGFRINNFTYITDANYISESEKEKIRGSEILVLNALRKEKHISHFNLEEAIHMAEELGAERTYFTHISHLLGKHEEISKTLPRGIFLAYDGLLIELKD